MSRQGQVKQHWLTLEQRDYPDFSEIPGHGRHQHFNVGGRDRIQQLLLAFPEEIDNTERCRRMIDLFVVSVLLDAGAGTEWSFKSSDNNRIYRRSEGIAVASLEMFRQVSDEYLRPLRRREADFARG